MDLPILLPGEVEITPFRVTLRERFRDVAQRIKVEFELPSDRDALFLVADGVRTSSKYMKGCPQGLLDPDDTVQRRKELLMAASQIRVVPRDIITAVYNAGEEGLPPKKMRYKTSHRPVSVQTEPFRKSVTRLDTIPSGSTSPRGNTNNPSSTSSSSSLSPRGGGGARGVGSATSASPAVAIPAEPSNSASEEIVIEAQHPAEFLSITVKFPATYPMDVQTMDLPLHYTVGKTIRYMLDVALVSEERAESLVLVVSTTADGSNLRRFKRSPLWPVLPNGELLGMFKDLLLECPQLELSYLAAERWSDPQRAGSLLVKEGDTKWLKRYCLLKDRQLFFFVEKPADQFALPCGRVFLDMCTKITISQGGENQVVKLAEKIGSKTRGYFLASNKVDLLLKWKAALDLEVEKVEAERAAAAARGAQLQSSAAGFGLEEVKEPEPEFDTRFLDQRKTMDLKDIVSKESPSKIYGNFVKIGRGAFSNVWTANDKITGEKVAIKVIKIEKKTFKYVRGEVVTMQRFESHPNVVRYINSFVLPKVEQIWIVMDFLEGGSLIDYCGPEQPFPEEQIAFVLRESFKALAYLHSKERIHRDIKSGNILVTGGGQVKLGDFGFATKLGDGRDRAKTVLGTPLWMAPEIHRREQYSASVDIWAMGIVAIEMAEGVPPHKGLNREEIREQVKTYGASLKHPERWSAEFNDILSQMLAMRSEDRPTAEQLLKHPFMSRAADRISMPKIEKKKGKDDPQPDEPKPTDGEEDP